MFDNEVGIIFRKYVVKYWTYKNMGAKGVRDPKTGSERKIAKIYSANDKFAKSGVGEESLDLLTQPPPFLDSRMQ